MMNSDRIRTNIQNMEKIQNTLKARYKRKTHRHWNIKDDLLVYCSKTFGTWLLQGK